MSDVREQQQTAVRKDVAEHLVELSPGGETFTARQDESVLDAALRQGISLKYGCRHGNCSTCKYLIEDGDVDLGDASAYSLPDEEREEGWALLCCATALSPLVIRDNREVDDRAMPFIAPSEQVGHVVSIVELTPELSELTVKVDMPLKFYPGQFAELGIAGHGGTLWRSYSMASPPSRSHELQFVIKRIKGGAFSGKLDTLSEGSPIQVRGPFGSSYLREGDRAVLLCAIGSGLAPILSMLRDAAERRDPRAFHLFYGARRPADVPYYEEIAEGMNRALGGRLRFTPTLDGLTAEDHWSGERGTVTQTIQRKLEGAQGVDAYLCGAPAMCETVARLLAAKGLPESQLFFDQFFPAAT